MSPDTIDPRLINLLQAEFPLTPQPFDDLGERLGISANEVIGRIRRLKEDGLVRQISPVIDGRRLGYKPTLVAMRVSEDDRPRAEDALLKHPGVSHGYVRDHHFNVWFTLALPEGADVQAELARITEGCNVEAVFPLPATRVFKIGAYFDVGGDGQGGAKAPVISNGKLPGRVGISDQDRAVMEELQQDLPLVRSPFAGMAQRLGLDEETFLARCRSLEQRGVMRRLGASVNHRQAGFEGNGMACWAVPADRVGDIGPRLAALPEVSHCYERATNQLWDYNIFAMIHSHTREGCRRIAEQAAHDLGLGEVQLLFSTREFKKERVRYLA